MLEKGRAMNSSKVQEERVRRYFIDSAKEIIRAEGINALNVRNVAQKAGYSYATIYNYFKDIKGLMAHCIEEFLEECSVSILQQAGHLDAGCERIRTMMKAYANYFVQYPGTYELFYLEKLPAMPNSKTIDMINSFFDKVMMEDWKECAEARNMLDAEIKWEIMKSMIGGMMLSYFSKYHPKDYKDFISQIDARVDFLIKN
jgi:AcrR family transcriptional regulator